MVGWDYLVCFAANAAGELSLPRQRLRLQRLVDSIPAEPARQTPFEPTLEIWEAIQACWDMGRGRGPVSMLPMRTPQETQLASESE